jgi:hypothetical protein
VRNIFPGLLRNPAGLNKCHSLHFSVREQSDTSPVRGILDEEGYIFSLFTEKKEKERKKHECGLEWTRLTRTCKITSVKMDTDKSLSLRLRTNIYRAATVSTFLWAQSSVQIREKERCIEQHHTSSMFHTDGSRRGGSSSQYQSPRFSVTRDLIGKL